MTDQTAGSGPFEPEAPRPSAAPGSSPAVPPAGPVAPAPGPVGAGPSGSPVRRTSLGGGAARPLPSLAEFRTMPLAISRSAFYVAAVATIVVFLSSFLPWFSVSLTFLGQGISRSGSGTDSPMLGTWTLLLSLASAAVLVLLVVRPDPRLWLGLPIAGALIVLFALISLARIGTASTDVGILDTAGVHVGSGIGLWLTLLAGVALLAAAVMAWRGRQTLPAA